MPRKYAWFIVLLGLLTIAHLWAHAAHVPDHVGATAVVTAGEGHPVDEDHDEKAHSHPFVTSAALYAPHSQDAWTAPSLLPQDSDQSLTTVPVGRSPPGDYRGRAALTQTLEVCRC
ncbi:hypothetical protein [Nonomuraea sp. B1E8]|uniref:hypothetical protein n=1 Tax=unclassified Nonomuraea TaxID=2593643 RepID=UPI00325DB13C